MNIAYFHPQVVHFVIALIFLGVIARVLSLLPLPHFLKFFSPAAATLLILGAIATIAAVKSGTDAHGPAERVPGARDLVIEHEELGKKARNIFLVVAAIEIAGIALYKRAKPARLVRAASGIVGVAGLFTLYHASEHGGELVYNYAGNVGLRSGDTTHLRSTLVAALYHNAMQQRAAGRSEDAARLMAELVRQRPGDVEVQLLGAESVLRDQKNPRGAIPILQLVEVPADNTRLANRRALLLGEAFVAADMRDSAKIVLDALTAHNPDNTRLRDQAARILADTGSQ